MPLERKLRKVGSNRVVTLPVSWLRNAERTKGKRVVAVEMEVNGSIKLKPIFESEVKT